MARGIRPETTYGFAGVRVLSVVMSDQMPESSASDHETRPKLSLYWWRLQHIFALSVAPDSIGGGDDSGLLSSDVIDPDLWWLHFLPERKPLPLRFAFMLCSSALARQLAHVAWLPPQRIERILRRGLFGLVARRTLFHPAAAEALCARRGARACTRTRIATRAWAPVDPPHRRPAVFALGRSGARLESGLSSPVLSTSMSLVLCVYAGLAILMYIVSLGLYL